MKSKTKYLLQDLENKVHRGSSEEYKIEVSREELSKEIVSDWGFLSRRREHILVMNEVLNEK